MSASSSLAVADPASMARRSSHEVVQPGRAFVEACAGQQVPVHGVGDPVVEIVSSAHQHGVPELAGPHDQLGAQAGLPDPGLAPDQERRRCALADPLELLQGGGKVELAPHERCHLHAGTRV